MPERDIDVERMGVRVGTGTGKRVTEGALDTVGVEVGIGVGVDVGEYVGIGVGIYQILR